MEWLRNLLLWFVSTPQRARFFASYGPRTLRLGGRCYVFRWEDVCSVLQNDTSFLIAPINEGRIKAVSGPFMLGMDRCPELFNQRSAAYRALASVDWMGIRNYLETAPPEILSQCSGSVDIVGHYALPVATEVATRVFGVRGSGDQDFNAIVRAVFHETFLNLQGDPAVTQKGRDAGQTLTSWIRAEVARRRSNDLAAGDMLGALLSAQGAGGLSDDEIGWIVAGFLVGSIDTTTTAVANIVTEALNDPTLFQAMRADVDEPRALQGWCWEALRRRPHNQLLLRVAAVGAAVAGKPVAEGSTVFCMLLTAMQDNAAWPDPKRMDPTRPRDRYLHFGRALHQCGGRDLNAIQIPALVRALLRRDLRPASAIEYEGPLPIRFMVSLGRKNDSA
jgi:cytochrome P450